MDHNLILAAGFRFIEGLVGFSQERFRLEVARCIGGDSEPDAECEVELLVTFEWEQCSLEAAQKPLASGNRAFATRLRQKHRELVSAESANDILLSLLVLHCVRDREKRSITDRVPMPVIDLLEIIEVDESHRERIVIAAGAFDLECQRLLEDVTTRQPGQSVSLRLIEQACVLEHRGGLMSDSVQGV